MKETEIPLEWDALKNLFANRIRFNQLFKNK